MMNTKGSSTLKKAVIDGRSTIKVNSLVRSKDTTDNNQIITWADYHSNFGWEHMNIKLLKYMIITRFQLVFFLILTFLGGQCLLIGGQCDYFEYKFYSFTNVLFIKFRRIFVYVYSNLTDEFVSIPLNINPHSFPMKLALTYHSLLVILMFYTWHQTIRLSFCIFTSFVIVMFIFNTDLVLIHDQIQYISFTMSVGFYISFSIVTMTYIPDYIEISSYQLCGSNMSLNDWYLHLQNGSSISARFYRWIKTTKNRWNIEEKFILTIIVTPISLCMMIMIYFSIWNQFSIVNKG